MKEAIIFDLDGTLAKSKSPLDDEMSLLLCNLLKIKKVAIISGGGFNQFKKQVIGRLNCENLFKNLYIFPAKGAMMYEFGIDWQLVYENPLTDEEKASVIDASKKVTAEVSFLPKSEDLFGDQLEDRTAEFTFSALGQNAPTELKEKWDEDVSKRQELKKHFEKYLPGFQIEIGGKTSIDITKKGMDKAYAIGQFCKYENLKIADILYIGDALFEGGNDYPVIKTGVDTVPVKDYNETKQVIKDLLK